MCFSKLEAAWYWRKSAERGNHETRVRLVTNSVTLYKVVNILNPPFPSYKPTGIETSVVVQRLRLHTSNARDTGSIPGWGTEIQMPHSAAKKKKKKLKKKASGMNYISVTLRLIAEKLLKVTCFSFSCLKLL